MRAHQGEQGRNDPDENGLMFHVFEPARLVISISRQVISLNLFFNEIDRLRPSLGLKVYPNDVLGVSDFTTSGRFIQSRDGRRRC